jgi:hypothetical protein
MIKIEKNEMGGACSAYGGGESMFKILEEKPDGKRPLGGGDPGRMILMRIFRK